jgi:hypothetical protein
MLSNYGSEYVKRVGRVEERNPTSAGHCDSGFVLIH